MIDMPPIMGPQKLEGAAGSDASPLGFMRFEGTMSASIPMVRCQRPLI